MCGGCLLFLFAQAAPGITWHLGLWVRSNPMCRGGIIEKHTGFLMSLWVFFTSPRLIFRCLLSERKINLYLISASIRRSYISFCWSLIIMVNEGGISGQWKVSVAIAAWMVNCGDLQILVGFFFFSSDEPVSCLLCLGYEGEDCLSGFLSLGQSRAASRCWGDPGELLFRESIYSQLPDCTG